MLDVKKTLTKLLKFARTPTVKDENFPLSTPSSNYWSSNQNPKTVFNIVDSEGVEAAFTQGFFMSNGKRGMELGTRRVVNGTNINNAVRFIVNDSGEREILVTNPEPWLKALGLAATVLTTTYTSNSYVDETAFNRIQVTRVGKLVVVNMNLNITTAMPKSSAATKIGEINGLGTVMQIASHAVPCMTSGTINIEIQANGDIRLYNYYSTNARGWCRASMTLVEK